jgi:choline dehydrogenase-like flavoprotein
VEAALSLQHPHCDDFNGARHEGFGFRQVTQRNGRRESAATAFLAPVAKRANLTIMTGAMVERVLIECGRAVAVETTFGPETRRILARREIVISGGAINSPMILLRSGVGAGEALRQHGIPVVADLPGVGANYQDHVSTPILTTTRSTEPYGISLRVLPRLFKELADYLLFRRGLIASNGLECGGFAKTSPVLDRADIQFSFAAGFRSASGRIGLGHGYGLTTILLRPKSRGTVRLSAKDTHSPSIDPNLLDAPDDVETLVKGLAMGRRILAAPAMAGYAGREVVPGAERTRDDDLADFVRLGSRTAYHPVGTCRMGIDRDAVVDPALRVRGVQGLRVVDASVIPSIIGGNTNAPVIMIAEKAADLIRGRPAPAAAELAVQAA